VALLPLDPYRSLHCGVRDGHCWSHRLKMQSVRTHHLLYLDVSPNRPSIQMRSNPARVLTNIVNTRILLCDAIKTSYKLRGRSRSINRLFPLSHKIYFLPAAVGVFLQSGVCSGPSVIFVQYNCVRVLVYDSRSEIVQMRSYRIGP
jgi:hypothetical protein